VSGEGGGELKGIVLDGSRWFFSKKDYPLLVFGEKNKVLA